MVPGIAWGNIKFTKDDAQILADEFVKAFGNRAPNAQTTFKQKYDKELGINEDGMIAVCDSGLGPDLVIVFDCKGFWEKFTLVEGTEEWVCKQMSNEHRSVQRYDSNTKTCYVIDSGDMIKEIYVADFRGDWSSSWGSGYAYEIGCSSRSAALSIYDGRQGGKYYVEGNKARFPCVFEEDKKNKEFIVDVSFTNKLLSEDEYLVKVCKQNSNCKCKKGPNGKDLCEIVYKQPFFVRGNVKHYEAFFSLDSFIGLENSDFVVELREEYDRIEDYTRMLHQLRQCSDNARKFCVKYDDVITVKFDDLRFSDDEYKKCEDKCAKQNSKPSVAAESFGGDCKCEITDEMYDKCEIECDNQGGIPVSSREEFDGDCKCKNTGIKPSGFNL